MSPVVTSIMPAEATAGDQLLTINNSAPELGDDFGYSIASTPDGNILVGASGDDTGATDAGSAYLFDGTSGDLLLTINNPAPDEYAYFGRSVATTPDGNIVVGASGDDTGASYAGSAYLFDGTSGDLLLTINNPAPDEYDDFGISVATTPDGNIVVSAFGDDANSVYLFDGTSGDLLLTINNPAPDEYNYFGISVASTPDGNILVGASGDDTGATDAGSVYLFDGTSGDLLLIINNPAPDEYDDFGISVTSTPDGNILVSAFGDDAGSVYLFEGIPPPNNPPILDFIPNQSVDEDTSLDLLISATDADSDVTSIQIDYILDFITFTDNGDNTATFLATPDISDSGVYTFTVSATDGTNTDYESFTLTINDIPSNGDLVPAITIDHNGNVGIGTEDSNSRLQIFDGYLQLDTSSGVPPLQDCDSTTDVGRMKVDSTANTSKLYVCTPAGWFTLE